MAQPQLSELAIAILHYIAANKEDQVAAMRNEELYEHFKTFGYEDATIYIAMRELYSHGYINTVTFH